MALRLLPLLVLIGVVLPSPGFGLSLLRGRSGTGAAAESKQKKKIRVLPEPPEHYGENIQGQDCRLMPSCAKNLGCTCYTDQCLGGVEPLFASLAPLTPPGPSMLGCKCCHRGDGWAPGMFPEYFPTFHIATTPFFIMPPTTPGPCDPAIGCCDKPNYKDEKGYGCDTWVGHACGMAVEEFEGKKGKDDKYTDAGEKDLMANCEVSCGLCGPAPAPAPVAATTTPAEAMAKR